MHKISRLYQLLDLFILKIMIVLWRDHNTSSRRQSCLNLWLPSFTSIEKAQVLLLMLRVPLLRPQAHVKRRLPFLVEIDLRLGKVIKLA